MKASELRIGNLIWNPVQKCAVTVTTRELSQIEYEKYLVKIGNPTPDFMQWQPIPLTEEWLLKFSFVKWKNKKIWTYKGIMIYQMSDGCFYYGKKSTRIKIETVHHCQNLYFALNVEELKLTK